MKKEKNNLVWTAVREKPECDELHLLYAVLFMLSVVAALWQKGNPSLTMGVLLTIPAATSIAWVPYSVFSPILRYIFRNLLLLLALLWIGWRLHCGELFDKVLAEALCIAAISFLTGGSRKEYWYVLLLSLLLLMYGSLTPRIVFLWVFFPASALLLFLIYYGRLKSLTESNILRKTNGLLRRNWHLYFLHLLLSVVVFWIIFARLPILPGAGKGVFEVSFRTDNTSMLPPDTAKWMKNPKAEMKASPDGIFSRKHGIPDSLGASGVPMTVKGPDAKSMTDGNGSGNPSEVLLFRVVMTAKLYHIVKIYDSYDGRKWHAAQKITRGPCSLNGNTAEMNARYEIVRFFSKSLPYPWYTSAVVPDGFSFASRASGMSFEMLDKEQIRMPFSYTAQFYVQFPDPGVLEGSAGPLLIRELPFEKKRFSPPKKIYQDYRNRLRQGLTDFNDPDLTWRLFLSHVHSGGKCFVSPNSMIVDKNGSRICRFYQHWLKKYASLRQNPSLLLPDAQKKTVYPRKNLKSRLLPWFVPPDQEMYFRGNKEYHEPVGVRDYWNEANSRSYYLKLPDPQKRFRISDRVLHLAHRITKNCDTPYRKAVALRNFLREHYSYQYYSRPTPSYKESVDFFLFTLQSGHCEYFASALAVMARAVGIPSRVVTGFSPGDYNTLDNVFEVRAKHAHAWTQLFIEGAGWMTFDATPQGAVPSETKPVGLGSFRDPFGDEWRIMPPEAAPALLKQIQTVLKKREKSTELNDPENSSMLENAVKTVADAENMLREKRENEKQQAKVNPAYKKRSLNAFGGFLKKLPGQILSGIKHSVQFLLNKKELILPFIITLAAFLLMIRILISHFRQMKHIRKILYFCSEAFSCESRDSVRAVKCFYFAVRQAMTLAGHSRPPEMDLMDFAAESEQKEPLLKSHAVPLFTLFYRVEYGSVLPSEAETAAAEKDALEIISGLFSKIRVRRRYYPNSSSKRSGKSG